MKKVRSMRAFFIIVRAVNYRLRTHWNYVGRHGADRFLPSYTRGLSGGQFTAAECFRCPVRDGRSCFAIRSIAIVTA